MARTRVIFFRGVQSFLGRKGWRKILRILIIFLFFILALNFPWIARQGIAQTPNLSSANLAQEGKISYEGGRFAESIEYWEKAITAFSLENDPLNQAMAFSNLSLTYQKLGKLEQADIAIGQSLKLLATQPNSKEQLRVLAQSLDILGQLYLSKGQAEAALQTWQESYQYYHQIEDDFAKIQNQINQAQAMQSLGLYQRSLTILTEVENALESNSLNLQLKSIGLRSLGNTLRLVGKLKESQEVLKASLKLAEQSKSYENIIASQLSLGDAQRALGYQERNLLIASGVKDLIKTQKNQEINQYYTDAVDWYKKVADSEAAGFNKIQAKLNLISLWLDSKHWVSQQSNLHQIDALEWESWFGQKAIKLASELKETIRKFPMSRKTIYAKINLAQSLVCLTSPSLKSDQIEYFSPIMQPCTLSRTETQDSALVDTSWREIAEILATAIQEAKTLKDERSQAYALGYLGGIYQQTQDWKNAEKLTQEALALTRLIQSPDIAYRWQWQQARLRKAQGDKDGAIAAYQTAFETLQALRKDLASISQDTQFNFRDSVEPFYRELAEFLLKDQQPSQDQLKLSRDVIEALQLAELDNFFRESCTPTQQETIDKLDPKTAVIYAIILNKKIEVILSLPQGELYRYQTSEINNIEYILEKLRENLGRPKDPDVVQEQSKLVYNWLIKPLEKDLTNHPEIATLVFVLDGSLRNIPMAVLYDESEQKYLIEKQYALVLAPGLKLIKSKPSPRTQLTILTGGLSKTKTVTLGENNQTFAALANVEQELIEIRAVIPKGKDLLNDTFTKESFVKEINSNTQYSIVHLATHAQFSSDPEKTFILTSDDPLKSQELKELLKTSGETKDKIIELLVLSACQTAQGDRRATLGLAGIAVRAGARSTLATLWQVNDLSTAEVMVKFYQELQNPNLTKAEALHQAQLALLSKEERPYYWGSYILIGNWL
ncbi:Tetratricopeptide repeat-containing protein 28 (plasmid) [Planktothrix agardhii]|uniref:Tetratricopeptide repeat-containing protein 28 n=1 Tax=Planktothrix agardhii (strain NIVA-CYA 126/8) TaxID=388467 RepID=A0A073CML8_PLAA1|nr:Tetratricopeptide repeat-containing protein 28 [Planktothrix agardhii NIVA-CYA 126/8]CAD5984404.1 Tetratricopeptide repeat-containing protein 28 [Planktothrix agardhii]